MIPFPHPGMGPGHPTPSTLPSLGYGTLGSSTPPRPGNLPPPPPRPGTCKSYQLDLGYLPPQMVLTSSGGHRSGRYACYWQLLHLHTWQDADINCCDVIFCLFFLSFLLSLPLSFGVKRPLLILWPT